MSANEIVTTATTSEVTLSVVMVTVLVLLVVCNLFMYTVKRMLTDPKFCLRQMVQRYTQKVPRVRVLEVHPKPRTPSLIGHSHADLISLLSHSANLQLEGISRETAYSPTLQLESATRETIHSSSLQDDSITREITPVYTKDDTWEAANINMTINCEMQKVEFIQEDVRKQVMSDPTDIQNMTDSNLHVPPSRKHKEIQQPVEEKKQKENGQNTKHTVPFSSKVLNLNKDKVQSKIANKDNRSISKGDNSLTTPYSDSMNLTSDKRTPATAKVGGVRPRKQISGQKEAAVSNSVVTQEQYATNVKQENIVNGNRENEGHKDGANEKAIAGDVLIKTSGPVVHVADINTSSTIIRCQETVSKGCQETVSKGCQETVSKGCQETVSKGCQETVSKGCQETVSKGCQETVSKGCQETVSKGCQETVSKGCQETVSKGCQETVSKGCQETVSKGCQETVSKGCQETVSKGCQETVSKGCQETVSKGCQETVSKGCQETVSKDCQETVSKGCQETVSKDATSGSKSQPVSNIEPETTNGSNIGHGTVPGSDINHGKTSGPNTGPGTPTGPSTGPETPTGPSTGPETPTSPSTGPETPTGPITGPETPTGPTTGPETPTGPSTGPGTPTGPNIRPGTPTGPSTGSRTPTGPSTGPETPTGPITGPETPTGPSTGPGTPTGPSTGSGTPIGPSTGSRTPTSPSTGPGTLTEPSTGPGTISRSDSEIGQIILTNTYDTPVIKFFKEMKSESIETPEEMTIIKGQVTGESEGMNGQTNKQVGHEQGGNPNLSEVNNYSRGNRNTDSEAEIKGGQIVTENGTDEQSIKEICSTSENDERELQDKQIYTGKTDREIPNKIESEVQDLVNEATGNQMTGAPAAADTKDSIKTDKEGNTEGTPIKSGVEDQKGESDSYRKMNKLSEEAREGDTSINTDIEREIETATNKKEQTKTEEIEEKDQVQLLSESDSEIKTEKERKEELKVFLNTESKNITKGVRNVEDSKSSVESEVEKDLTEYIRSNTMETHDNVDDKVEDEVVDEKVGDNDKVSSLKDAKPTTNNKSSKQEVVTTKSQAVRARNMASKRNGKRFKQLKLTH
ncbi:mucin-12-like [Mizuhopecten yessoensis]|uniref:mucin-12-like n=1 Tax=Mizuhopecten yessoensis TaxID=6573 RepID=UPI000B4592F5|nr:mucin-12-like [Mizuhopecten yessoensis]